MHYTYRMKAVTYFAAVLLFLTSSASAEDKKWTIHEWGTFTSLQNESGDAIGGINSDDEPVPPFVHRLANFLVLQPTEMPYSFCQGAPACHPEVTMRLETPVIYFHPPAGEKNISSANVVVKFRGGWLTEYYPFAEPTAPHLKPDGVNPTNSINPEFEFGHLRADTESKLEWNNLQIGGNWSFTNTSAHVWTSPRAVQAASVQTANLESEKFLFYRGVAHIDAPLKISRDKNTGELLFRSQLNNLPITKPLALKSIWLVDIRANGKVAFRPLPPFSIDHNSKKIVAHTAVEFDSKDFDSSNLDKLKTSLRAALITDGLFADEADALLNTWELSYFKSSGLRVFFLVPREWTDHYLPLDISLPSDINRVMVGRIELVTPEQRKQLAAISQFSPATIQAEFGLIWTNFYATAAGKQGEFEKIWIEKKPLSADIPVPHTYQTFLDLGRFRHALVLDEANRHPTPGLTNFISAYRLAAFKPTDKMPDRPAAVEISKAVAK
jgi:hypothetical protein